MSTKLVGRPTDYDPLFCDKARKLCELGANDREIAEIFGVTETTLHRWKLTYPEFCKSIKVGKNPCNERVKLSLYRRATGYSYDAVKIFLHEGEIIEAPYTEHVPPDTKAIHMWLLNRDRENWKDTTNVEVSGAIALNINLGTLPE